MGCSPVRHLCGAGSWVVAVRAMAVRAMSHGLAVGEGGLCAVVMTGE